jgi:tetratricopeptide (TPR) repeat protein
MEAAIDALSRIAILQFQAGRSDDAARLVSEIMQDVRLSNTRAGRDDALGQVAELLTRAQHWSKAREVASEIQNPDVRSNTQVGIERALIDANEFDAAQQMLGELKSPSARAQSLLALIRKVYEVGGTPTRPIDNVSIIRMLNHARGYAEQDEEKGPSAAALRSIARAFAELHTGDADGAISTMWASVQAMNGVKKFGFVPTPWCDTAVAFAELGRWDTAMEMARWQVETNPLDGCCSLRDLAASAGKRGDLERAKALLTEARNSVEKIRIPPQRSDVLTSIAQEYARIGMVEEAKEVARASGETAQAQAKITVALLESGNVTEGIKAIDELERGALDRSSYQIVKALNAAGQIDKAYSVAANVMSGAERAELLLRVARVQIAGGKKDEARKTIENALALRGSLAKSWAETRVRRMIPAVLAELGDFGVVEQLIEQEWLAAPARTDLLALIPLAGPLVSRQPDLPERIHASFAWVEQTLLTV